MRPSVEAAAGGNSNLRLLLTDVMNRLAAQEEATGNISSNSDSQTPVNPAPPQAKAVQVPLASGLISLRLTNPQFVNSATPGKKRGNLSRTPISHEVHYSPDSRFRVNVSQLPVGVDVHHVIPSGQHVRWRSSYDGVNFNQWQYA